MPRVIGLARCTAPLTALILSLFILSARYNTSAAYEQPILLGLFTLGVAASVCLVWTRFSKQYLNPKSLSLASLWLPSDREVGQPAESRKGRIAHIFRSSAQRVRRLPTSLTLLVGCLVARLYLFWFVVRTTQCSILGTEAFLPFVALLCSSFKVLGIGSPESNLEETTDPISVPRRHRSPILYGLASCVWGFVAISLLSQLRIATGTGCPAGWQWRPCVVAAQFSACLIDALLLVSVSDTHRVQQAVGRTDGAGYIHLVPLVSGLVAPLVVLPTLFSDVARSWILYMQWSDFKDLTVDSLLVSTALLCTLSVLHLLHPTTVAFVISTVSIFGSRIIQLAGWILRQTPPPKDVSRVHLAAALLIGFLGRNTLYPIKSPQPSTNTILHRCISAVFIGISALFIVAGLLSSPPVTMTLSSVVTQLVDVAGARFESWKHNATTSQNLQDAVAEYRQRYGLPPPPNFDKWYKFAIDNNSPVIDEFNQIHQDLFQFWAVEPATIRSRTAHLFAYSNLEIGGLRIQGGAIEQSPHVPGTHRWMMDSLQRMIEPFAKWLPDMDIALNLADECRIAIPYEEVKANKAGANKAMVQMTQAGRKSPSESITSLNESHWPASFSEPFPRKVKSPHFTEYFRRQLYYDLVAPSCPPHSPARRKRWWDWSTVCAECLTPHTVITDDGPVVSDTELAHDLCHQPDMAHLDGFIMSPSVGIGTKMLFPIFSQGRVGGFSDILIPSPWNFDQKSVYDDATDVAWGNKRKALFWRGSSSDGYATHGSWTGFLRARLVHEAYQRRARSEHDSTHANVSFVGTMSRCDEADCDTELHTFHTWSTDLQATSGQAQGEQHDSASGTSTSPLPPISPFEEHWKFRHLIDLDGAGFSGRFLPFLLSQSLVYRAGLFHTWFDERLRAWHHYVPVDMRLGRGFWALVDFFSGGPSEGEGDSSGDQYAEKIAKQGSDWAQKALRPEDMQVYMFRLLLEWGRIVDDDRENLGFEI